MKYAMICIVVLAVLNFDAQAKDTDWVLKSYDNNIATVEHAGFSYVGSCVHTIVMADKAFPGGEVKVIKDEYSKSGTTIETVFPKDCSGLTHRVGKHFHSCSSKLEKECAEENKVPQGFDFRFLDERKGILVGITFENIPPSVGK